MVENLVEISGRSQLYDLEESSPNALKSDKSTNKNGIVNIMCLILLRFCDIMYVIYYKEKGDFMISFLTAIAVLLVGFLTYGKFTEKVFAPDDRKTLQSL